MFDGTPIVGLSKAVKMSVMDANQAYARHHFDGGHLRGDRANVLAQQAGMDIGRWKCLLGTVAFGFFFRFLFYIVLLFGSKNKRR